MIHALTGDAGAGPEAGQPAAAGEAGVNGTEALTAAQQQARRDVWTPDTAAKARATLVYAEWLLALYDEHRARRDDAAAGQVVQGALTAHVEHMRKHLQTPG